MVGVDVVEESLSVARAHLQFAPSSLASRIEYRCTSAGNEERFLVEPFLLFPTSERSVSRDCFSFVRWDVCFCDQSLVLDPFRSSPFPFFSISIRCLLLSIIEKLAMSERESFDVVCALDVIEHVANVKLFLQSAVSMAKVSALFRSSLFSSIFYLFFFFFFSFPLHW